MILYLEFKLFNEHFEVLVKHELSWSYSFQTMYVRTPISPEGQVGDDFEPPSPPKKKILISIFGGVLWNKI